MAVVLIEMEKKLHREGIVALMKVESLRITTAYDALLAKMIDSGRNTTALDFAGYLIMRDVVEQRIATDAEMYATVEMMLKGGRRPNVPIFPSCPEGLPKFVEKARNVVHMVNITGTGAA